jgi:hypothetical protein
MKTIIIIAIVFAMVTASTLELLNSGKGPSKLKEGITELPAPRNDSIIERGKKLVSQANYSNEDLEAIADYLNK